MSRLERENRPEGSTLAKKQFQRMYHESLARQIQENNMKKIVQERGESMGNRPPPSIPGIPAQQPYQQPQLFASYQPHDQQSHSESPARHISEYIPSNYNIQQQPDPIPRMASMPKQPIYPVPNGIYNTAIINPQKVAETSAPQPDLQAQKKAAYQKELLLQIEERKRREAEEKARKKQEDLLEMQRIQKEIEKEKREQEIAEEKAKQAKAGMAAQQDGFGMVKVPPPRKQTQQGSRAAAQQDVAQEGVMKPAAVLDTDVSKQYVMYTKQNQDVKQNNDAPQFNEPPQQPLQINEPPPPEVKLAAPLSTDVSRQYLQQMGGGQGNQPNTVNKSPGFGLTAIKKEIHSELQKQLSSLQNPDGMLYQQINNKFQEGFVQIREDIQRANHELVSNLEKLKQETKVAAMERDKVVRELEDVKRARPNGNAPGSFGNAPLKKPFGGIDNDEIDSLLQRYGSKEALEGLNLDRREPVRPSRNIPAFEDQRQSNQMQDYRDFQATGQNEPKRYASQPIKMYNKNGQISQEQLMHGSINLDAQSNFVPLEVFEKAQPGEMTLRGLQKYGSTNQNQQQGHQKKANATREQPKSKFFGGAPHHDPSDPMFRPYDMLLNPSTTAGNPLHELDRLKYPSVSSLGNTNKQQARPYSNQMPQNPARQQQYNPSKTSNLFRNAGNMMMDGTTEFQPLKQNNGLKGTANYGSALGMGDSVDQIMLRYNGAGGPSKRAGQYMNSPPGHGKGAGNRDSFELTGLGQTTGSVVPGGLHGDSTSNRNSFDIDKLISKNDERMKLLDKYKGLQMESIDEGFEGTNESMAFKGKVGKSKIPKASYLNDSAAIKSPPGLKESKTDMLAGGLGNNSMAADFDNLDAIINKYK